VEQVGDPAVGDLRGLLDVLRPERGDPDRDGVALGAGEQLERFAEPGDRAVLLGEREVELAVRGQRLPPEARCG
jgi:hypothetical protein